MTYGWKGGSHFNISSPAGVCWKSIFVEDPRLRDLAAFFRNSHGTCHGTVDAMELWAVIVSGFFLLSCVLCQGGIYLKWFTECCKDFASKPYTLIQEADEGESDVESLAQRLRCEARLMLVLPFLPILAAPYTTCEGGMPFWAYLLCIPFLIRSKWVAAWMKEQSPFSQMCYIIIS